MVAFMLKLSWTLETGFKSSFVLKELCHGIHGGVPAIYDVGDM